LVQTHWPPLHEQLLQPSKFESPSLQAGGGHPISVHCHSPSALHVQVLQLPSGRVAPGVQGTEPPASWAGHAISVQAQLPSEQLQVLQPSSDGAVPLPVHWLPGFTPCVLEPASKLPPHAAANANASAPMVSERNV